MDNVNKELNNNYIKEFKKLINIDVELSKSTIARIVKNGQLLKYNFLFDKKNMLTTIFRAIKDKTTAIYAILFSEIINNNIVHKYVSTGPTFISQDGEYRHRTVPYNIINIALEKYCKQIDMVEDMIVYKINNNLLEFKVEFFYPQDFLFNENLFEDSINNLRLPIIYFIICWIYDFHQIHNKIMENHINPAYQYIIYDLSDLLLYNKIINSFNNKILDYKNMIKRFIWYKPSTKTSESEPFLETGQKIIPMTYNESINIGDITFGIWRELWVLIYATNLVINFISPCFPIFNNWFYVNNSNQNLYDNYSINLKYEHSKIANNIRDQLLDIDKYNYIQNDPVIGPISGKFQKMSYKIRKSISYLESSIRLTDLSIALHMEHVGRTLRDIPVLVKHDEVTFAFDKFFIDFDVFSKHLFEYIYSFYCLNTKLEVLHGDIHLNNITLYLLIDIFKKEESIIRDPVIVYKLVDDLFVFPHYSVYSAIIDFSRSIINNKALIEKEYGKSYTEKFFSEQNYRIITELSNKMPEFMKEHKDHILALLLEDFNLAFKILSAGDAYSLCKSITKLFEVEFTKILPDEKKIIIPNQSKELLKTIENFAYNFIIENFQKAFKREITDVINPNLYILTTYFSDYIKPIEKIEGTIMDAFDSNNGLKYNIQKYEDYPYFLRVEPIINALKKYDVLENISDYENLIKILKDWTLSNNIYNLKLDEYTTGLGEYPLAPIEEVQCSKDKNYIFMSIQKTITTDNFPIYTYSDIPEKLSYQANCRVLNLNCHLNQRKLALSDIQFYSKYVANPSDKTIIVYAGSANYEHIPFILELFPDVKFILIDPRFHNINANFQYIYQNIKSIEKKDVNHNINLLNQYKSEGLRKVEASLALSIEKLKKTKFMFNDGVIDVLYAAKNYIEGKKDIPEIKKIEEIYKKFDINFQMMIKNIINSSDRIFIIQDYVTTGLMEKIRKSIDEYDSTLNILLISAVRTMMENYSIADDINIIWNNIQQISFAKVLNPSVTMVRFRPPYFNDASVLIGQFIKDIKNKNYVDGKDIPYNFIVRDIKKLSKYYDIDNIFIDGKYQYISDKDILIQPWFPYSSTETKMIITKNELYNKFIDYDVDDWSSTFYYYRFYRMYAFFPSYIEQFKKHNLEFAYDGCMDCSLEIQILSEYLDKNHLTYKEIIEKLKDKLFCTQLLKLYNRLNSSVNYGLGGPKDIKKCILHGWLNEKPKEVYVYNLETKLGLLYQMKITKETIDNAFIYKFVEKRSMQLIPYHKLLKISNKKYITNSDFLNYMLKYASVRGDSD